MGYFKGWEVSDRLRELFYELLQEYDRLDDDLFNEKIKEFDLENVKKSVVLKHLEKHLEEFVKESQDLRNIIGDDSYEEGHEHYEDMCTLSLMIVQSIAMKKIIEA